MKNERASGEAEPMATNVGESVLDPLQDRVQVRLFTLADYVAEESSGKLYISGSGLEWTGLPTRDDKIASCFLVARIAFPKAIARSNHVIIVRVLDDAGKPAGPDPLLKAEMKFDLNHAPGYFTEVSGNLPVQLTDYPLFADVTRTIFFSLAVDGVEVSLLPAQLTRLDASSLNE